MVRVGLVILGTALGLLSAFGLSADRGVTMLWFDAIAAIVAFGSALIIEDEQQLGTSLAGAPGMLAAGLVAVGLVGLAWGQPRWAVALNFVLAAVALVLAITGLSEGRWHVSRRTHA
jgi:hypothetical protein